MIHISKSIPRDQKIGIAVSGGPDSMAILDFLSRGGFDICAVHYDHGTEHGSEAAAFVTEYCKEKNIELFLSKKNRERTKDESPEEYWRNLRYGFFNSLPFKIITCHVLDDQVEQWIMTSLHGNPRLIPYENRNVFRPFMTTTKAELLEWCERKKVPYLVDPSNSSPKYMRSYVRTEIVPRALKVNPGLYKVVKKKINTLMRA